MAEKKPKKQEKPEQREWRLKKGLDAFGNMFGLNVCFVIACIPVITIGASLSATYAMAIRLQEDEEETILHGFIHEFKRSFKKATIAWLLVLVATAVLLAENILANNTNSHGIAVFYTIVFYLELLLVALVLAFLFPMIGRYDTTVKLAIKNSLLLSVGYVWSAIKIIVAWVAPIALSIIYPIIFLYTWYLWLLLLFGAIIWGTTHSIRYVFNKNDEAMENTREQKEREAREAEIAAGDASKNKVVSKKANTSKSRNEVNKADKNAVKSEKDTEDMEKTEDGISADENKTGIIIQNNMITKKPATLQAFFCFVVLGYLLELTFSYSSFRPLTISSVMSIVWYTFCKSSSSSRRSIRRMTFFASATETAFGWLAIMVSSAPFVSMPSASSAFLTAMRSPASV